MANWRFYSNVSIADTLLVTGGGNMTTGGLSIYAGSGAPAGYPTSFPWILQIEPGTANFELVLIVSGAGTLASPWIIQTSTGRGADGTTARTHTAGVAIQHTMSAFDLTTAANHEAAAAAQLPHGLPASAWLTGTFQNFDTTLTTAAQASLTWSSIPQTSSHLLIIAQGRLAEATVLSDDVTLQFNGDSGAHYSYITQYATTVPNTPGFPATTVGVQNTNPYAVQVVLTAGTITNVVVNGVSVGTTDGTYYVSPGCTIAVTYTGSPAWVWTMADPAANNGFALASAPVFRFTASQSGAVANVGGGFCVIPNYTSAAFNKMGYVLSGGGDGTSSFFDMRTRLFCWNPASQAAVTSLSLIAPTGGFNINCSFELCGFG